MRDLILKLLYPIEILIAFVSRPEFTISSEQILRFKLKLSDGCILVSKTDWELSNKLLPGEWKHCGIYFDGYVYESTTHGVRKVLVDVWLATKDHAGLLRARRNFTANDFLSSRIYLEECIGAGYDYSFRLFRDLKFKKKSNRHLFCSAYAYGFLYRLDKKLARSIHLENMFGQKTISPTDFWNSDMFVQLERIN